MEKTQRKNIILILLPLLLLAIAVTSMVFFQNATVERLHTQTRAGLQTQVQQQSAKMQSDLSAQVVLLKTFATTVAAQNSDIIAEMERCINDVTQSSKFESMFYVQPDGSAISNEGRVFSVFDRSYFHDSMKGETCIQKVSQDKLQQKAQIVISVPVYRGTEVVALLCGTYDEPSFRHLIFPVGSGNCFIATSDGEIIIGSTSSGTLLDGSNAFVPLSKCDFLEDRTWQDFRYDINRKIPGIAVFRLSGADYYISYQSFRINDWTVFNVVPATTADAPTENLVRSGNIQISILCIVFLLCLIIEINGIRRQLHHVEVEEDYKNQLSLYRTSRLGGVLRYKIDEYLTLLYANDKCYQIIGYTANEARNLLYRHCINFIHPDDREMVVKKFHEALESHAERLEWVMRIITADGTIKYILSDGKFEEQSGDTVLVGIVIDITQQKMAELALQKEKDALQLSEKRFRFALENTSVCIWEYDIATHKALLEQPSGTSHGLPHEVENAPESLIESGYITPESAEDCRNIYRRLDAGEKNAEGILCVRTPDREGTWYEYIRYTAIYNSEGKPFRAIGVSEDVTERVVAVRKYEKEASLRHAIIQDVYASAILNLYEETVESLDIDNPHLWEHAANMSIGQLFCDLASGVVEDQRARRSISSLSAESLRRTFSEGQEDISFEFQWKPDEHPAQWFSFEIRMTINPTNKVLYAFLYLRNIDADKREKELLERQAHTDPLTGLYNVATARRLIDSYLTGEGMHSFCAFLMLDLDCFKQVNDQLSHYEGDRVLIRVAAELQKQFRRDDLIARIGGDEFIVFLKDIPSVKFLRIKAALLCEALQFTQSNENAVVHISCSAGISLCEGGSKTYSDLYQEADRALNYTKNNGKNHYCLLQDMEEEGQELLSPGAEPVSLTARNNTMQLSALLQYMEGGVLLVEIADTLNILYASPSYYACVGRSVPDGQADSDTIFGFVHHQERPAVIAALRDGAETQTVVDITYRVSPGGEQIGWHHLRAVHIPYEGTLNPVLIAVITDITEWQQSAEQLSEDRKKLSLALEQTDLRIWNYDREQKRLCPDGDSPILEDVPESLIAGGLIHADSIEPFQQFFRQVNSNIRSGRVVIKSRHLSHDYIWLKISFINIFDENGVWQKTIGVTNRLPYIDVQMGFREQEVFLQQMLLDVGSFGTVRVNLSTRVVEELHFRRYHYSAKANVLVRSYGALLRLMAGSAADEQERARLMHLFSPDSIIEAYESGRRWIPVDFRRRDAKGAISWCFAGISVISDAITGQLLCFGYLRNIDVRKRWEESLPAAPIYDPRLTLYSPVTTQAMVEHVIELFRQAHSICAFAVLRVEGLSRIQEEKGYNAASEILLLVSRICSLSFGNRAVVGSLPDDQIALFLPAESSSGSVEERLQKLLVLFQRVHRNLFADQELSFLMGCMVSSCTDASCEVLMQGALAATDTIGVLPAGQDIALHMADSQSVFDTPTLFAARSAIEQRLDSTAQTLLNAAIRVILLSSSSLECADGLLPLISDYYRADRAYVLGVSEDHRVVTMKAEWRQEGVSSVLPHYNNIPLESQPILQTVIDLRKIQTISSEESGDQCAHIIAPILHGGCVAALLCIDAPGQQNIDALSLLLDYLQHACLFKSFDSPSEVSYYVDSLTGLYNRNQYNCRMAACSRMESGTVGIAHADLNGLSRVNSELGNQYGDQMVLFAAQCFKHIFGIENVYRISGDEFVVIIENSSYAEFGRLCDNAKAMFDNKYHDGISIGYAWADSDYKLSVMEDHALAIMRLNKQNYYARLMALGTIERPELLEHLLEDLEKGRYVMFLQPKIRINDQSIYGAEALVRYRDEQKGLISPSSFISSFESQNIIRHIDLFILEQAAQTLSRWIEEKKPLIPIAVNFSRKTFLDRTVLQRTTEIVEQYRIPLTLLEIEVTESVADVERATLSEFCRRYREKGFRLALDDFGSEYSSLSVLSTIHFDVLKLDKSLIDNITENHISRIIAQNTISLCRQIGITTVAEGVETREQFELLAKMECDIAQGFYFNKPIPVLLFEETYQTYRDQHPAHPPFLQTSDT